MENILYAVLWFMLLGGVFGVLLAIASKLFHVETDPRIEQVQECLPGANCGGCGYAGCGQLAEKIVSGEASSGACLACTKENSAKIADIMGIEVSESVRKRAHIACSGKDHCTKNKYVYEGEADCNAAMRVGGGDKACPFACIGLGTCVSACKFDALSIHDGVAQVDFSKCVGCGMCAKVCPKNIIEIIPFDISYSVCCSSKDKGGITREYCDVGCIGCKLCEKACQCGAISVTDNIAKIDYAKCTGCGACADKCPRKIIKKGIRIVVDTENDE